MKMAVSSRIAATFERREETLLEKIKGNFDEQGSGSQIADLIPDDYTLTQLKAKEESTLDRLKQDALRQKKILSSGDWK